MFRVAEHERKAGLLSAKAEVTGKDLDILEDGHADTESHRGSLYCRSVKS